MFLSFFLFFIFLLLWVFSICGVLVVSVPVSVAFLSLWIIFLIVSVSGYWSPGFFNYGMYNTWNIGFILWAIFFVLWVLADCSILSVQNTITKVFLILWIVFLVIWFFGLGYGGNRRFFVQNPV